MRYERTSVLSEPASLDQPILRRAHHRATDSAIDPAEADFANPQIEQAMIGLSKRGDQVGIIWSV